MTRPRSAVSNFRARDHWSPLGHHTPHGWVCPARPSSQGPQSWVNAGVLCCACELSLWSGIEISTCTPAGRSPHCCSCCCSCSYYICHPIPSPPFETYTSFWSSVSVGRDCYPSASFSSHLIRPPPLLGSTRSFCTNVYDGTGKTEIPQQGEKCFGVLSPNPRSLQVALCWLRR